MLNFEKFLLLVSIPNREKAMKYKDSFFVMYDYARPTPVATVGFNISFDSEDFPDEKDWIETCELVEFFKPLTAWIGTKENREIFKKKFPKISVEAYSFFEDGGFVPVLTIPIAMMDWFDVNK